MLPLHVATMEYTRYKEICPDRLFLFSQVTGMEKSPAGNRSLKKGSGEQSVLSIPSTVIVNQGATL